MVNVRVPINPNLSGATAMSGLEMVASNGNGAGAARALNVSRPPVIVCRGFGLATLRAIVRRSTLSRQRLLLRVDQLPYPLRSVHRIILAGVDVVLVDSDRMARALRACGVTASRIVLLSDPNDLALFTAAPRSRVDTEVHRILHVGDLEPEAGVADLLPCILAWAERHQERNIEVWWAGEGCLRGVLQAQPLPTNTVQRFLGEVSRQQLAALFLECDMLVAPAISNPWSHLISEAMAAGLPVLGSNRVLATRELVTEGETGWIFDPFEAGSMACAVDIALNTSPEALEHMRICCAARFRSISAPGFNERIWSAMQLTPASWSGFKPIKVSK